MSPHRRSLAALTATLLIATLAACAPTAETAGQPGTGTSPSVSGPSATTHATPTVTGPSPSPAIAIPTDCKAILTADVLTQLDGIPLGDPAFGPSGTMPDGSLKCIWASPGADTTGLTTTISHMSRGPALDLMNGLAATAGYTCYTPDGGTRCDGSWANTTYPVVDGRTLFWRDGILVDTQYSNLAPHGYTSAIIAHMWG